uniref:Uncharacterized protein n=1 Tax=Morchella brunnea TaxID=1174671 RepID=A0A8K1I7X2_9PEZI|nr:hypothetical protein LK370_mgp112 [Morchella brunnea]UBU98548.1 hypothetical protein [Morchella brunnea]
MLHLKLSADGFSPSVKKLKRWSKSAGNSFIYLFYNIFINKTGTSETLRNEIAINTWPITSPGSNGAGGDEMRLRIKPISVHVPTVSPFLLIFVTKIKRKGH